MTKTKTNINSIYDLVEYNERTVAVFTTHDQWSSNLKINSNGTGFTGDWVLRGNPSVEYVIIYKRLINKNIFENYIYKGNITSIHGPLSKYTGRSRYIIKFSGLNLRGVTQANWSDFANCGANPVRYINT